MKKRLLSTLLVLCTSPLHAQLFEEKPDILVCSVSSKATSENWDKFVFYISGTRKDGSVLYKSLTSNPVLISLGEDGTLSAPNLEDCHNKHIDTLWREGRAANFSKG